MIKSRAAVAFEAKKPLEIVEVDVAMPKAGEVLLRVVASGVCHTATPTPCLARIRKASSHPFSVTKVVRLSRPSAKA